MSKKEVMIRRTFNFVDVWSATVAKIGLWTEGNRRQRGVKGE